MTHPGLLAPPPSPLLMFLSTDCFFLLLLISVFLGETHAPRESPSCLCACLQYPFVRFVMCVCVFWFEPSSDCCSSVSDHTVVLVAVFLHKFPLPPHQRGFFCNDNSIKLTYKSSTVSNTALTAVGVTVPVVSVSPAAVRPEEAREGATGPARFFQWLG